MCILCSTVQCNKVQNCNVVANAVESMIRMCTKVLSRVQRTAARLADQTNIAHPGGFLVSHTNQTTPI